MDLSIGYSMTVFYDGFRSIRLVRDVGKRTLGVEPLSLEIRQRAPGGDRCEVSRA